ncbi:RMD1 family protein [Gorillibacterium timonense]|uniref:RMD1 family protein n=1 Tax=Gorillibacterium timonense TaxID=1689269 RepID=UPI00071D7DE2|nr:RMD1 family protein [Gorillibacterium timonense]
MHTDDSGSLLRLPRMAPDSDSASASAPPAPPARLLRFKSCVIGSSIDLDKPASFFRIERTVSWKEYLELNEAHLERILQKPCPGKRVYLFEYGCATFLDLDEGEQQTFYEFLAGLVDEIDYAMVARYTESHVLEVDEEGEFSPWDGSPLRFRVEESILPLVASLLAKSAALTKIEADVDDHLDQSEQLIDNLQRGRLRFNKRSSSSVLAKFLKFEFDSILTIRIFDRTTAEGDSWNSRSLYDALAEHYELNDRYEVIESKMGSLRTAMKTHNSLSFESNENRLYVWEIFLLLLFPLGALVRMLLHH